jgi:hypothetical protein
MPSVPSMRVSPDVVVQDVGDGLVLLNLRTGIYWGLNRTGAVIWRGIENRTRIETVCRQLQTEFDGSEDELAAAVHNLLSELANERLIVEAVKGTRGQDVPARENEGAQPQKRSTMAKISGKKSAKPRGKKR